MSELAFASATTLAAKIQNKDISAVELLNFYLARTDEHNSELNAIVVDTREYALADAQQADADLAKGHVQGPLHGVPMTVKESFHLAGTASTWGNPALKDNVFFSGSDAERALSRTLTPLDPAGSHRAGRGGLTASWRGRAFERECGPEVAARDLRPKA